jgi:hypothetical protein
MKTTRLARTLGLDGNILRRRTDKIAAWAAIVLVTVFLIGAPLLSGAAAGWAGRTGHAGQSRGLLGHQVPAVSPSAAPAVAAPSSIFARPPVQPRWAIPPMRARPGQIPFGTGLVAGRTAPLWMGGRTSPTDPPLLRRTYPPLNPDAVVARVTVAAIIATTALGAVLSCLAWAGRRVLDRRRLAGWEAEWAIVGPQWAKRFRSRG